MPQYSAQPPLLWSIPWLSTARLFGVVVLILTLSTSLLTFAHSDRMPASHTNSQPFYLRRKAVLPLVCRAQELEHLLYERLLSLLITKATKINSLICACCTKTAERPHPVRHQCSTMAEYRWSMG